MKNWKKNNIHTIRVNDKRPCMRAIGWGQMPCCFHRLTRIWYTCIECKKPPTEIQQKQLNKTIHSICNNISNCENILRNEWMCHSHFDQYTNAQFIIIYSRLLVFQRMFDQYYRFKNVCVCGMNERQKQNINITWTTINSI